MATLLVITIPFLAAIVVAGRIHVKQHYSAIVAVAAGLTLLVLVGLLLNGSLAGYGLALPVFAASALMLNPQGGRWGTWLLGVTGLLVIGALFVLEVIPIGSSKIGADATSSVQSRSEILATTSRGIADFMPFGSGLGTFQKVYPLYKSTERVTATFVIHAHNDYVEVALELGLAEIILVLLFLAVVGGLGGQGLENRGIGAFRPRSCDRIGGGAGPQRGRLPAANRSHRRLLRHVPALLADSRAAPPPESAELRRTRHIEIL